MSTSAVLEPIASALKDKLAAVTVTFASGQTRTLKAYRWIPREFENLPAGAVGLPEVERVGLDEPEMQLGSSEWRITYPVSIYFDISEVSQMQSAAAEAAEAVIKAIDNDSQLSGAVDDAKVVRVTPFVEAERRRPLAGYECSVEILKQVAYG